jgi:hypothetical protein
MIEKTITLRINVTATIRDVKTGRIKRVQKRHNLLPTVGRTAVAAHLGDTTPSPSVLYPNYVALGSGTNAPANGDTTLQTEVYRNLVASRTYANNIAYLTGFFSATETNGTYKEAGLFIEGTGAANSGTLFSRVALNITKSNTETLTLDWTITIT